MLLGVELSHDLPETWAAMDAVTVIKCLDEDGDVTYAIRTSSSLNPAEALGMLRFGTLSAERAMTETPPEEG